MIYINTFKQITNDAVDSLYGLVKDLINKNTTNILEVGTYAGQATVRLCAAAGEKSDSVSVISIDDNNDTFSPSAEESLKEISDKVASFSKKNKQDVFDAVMKIGKEKNWFTEYVTDKVFGD